MPSELPGGEQNLENINLLNAMFFVPVHTFARVTLSENQLKIGITLDTQFQELLKDDPKAVEYTMVRSLIQERSDTVRQSPLLTASTPELQAFVTKYADDERLFAQGKPLTRKPGNAAQ
jgi:hypothetical protein